MFPDHANGPMLSDLRLFVRATELSGLGRAARVLGIPAASATRQLQRLEAALGQRLIHRSSRAFVLTEEGRALLPHASRAIAEVDEAIASLRDLNGPLRGALRIAAPHRYGQSVIGPLLPSFMAAHPALEVTLQLGSQPADLRRDEADVAIRIGDPGDDQLIVRRLSTEEVVLCASPAYLAHAAEVRDVSDLAAHRLLTYRTAPGPQELELHDGRERRAIRILPALRCNEPVVLVHAAAQGAGIAVAPLTFARRMIEDGALTIVLSQWRPAALDINALYAPGRGRSAQIRAFLNFLISALPSSHGARRQDAE